MLLIGGAGVGVLTQRQATSSAPAGATAFTVAPASAPHAAAPAKAPLAKVHVHVDGTAGVLVSIDAAIAGAASGDVDLTPRPGKRVIVIVSERAGYFPSTTEVPADRDAVAHAELQKRRTPARKRVEEIKDPFLP